MQCASLCAAMVNFFGSSAASREGRPLLDHEQEAQSKVVKSTNALWQSKVMAVFVGWLFKDSFSMTLCALLFDDDLHFAKESKTAEDTSRPSWEFLIYLFLVVAGAFCATQVERSQSCGNISKVPFVAGFNFMPAWALKTCVSSIAAELTLTTSYDYVGNAAVQFMIMYLFLVAAASTQYFAKKGELHCNAEGLTYHVFHMLDLSLALTAGFTVDNFLTVGVFPVSGDTLAFNVAYVVAATFGCMTLKARITKWKAEHEATLGAMRLAAINLVLSSMLFVMAWSYEHLIDYFLEDDKLLMQACLVTVVGFTITALSAMYSFHEDVVVGIMGLNIAWAWMDYLAFALPTSMTLVELWFLVVFVCAAIAAVTSLGERGAKYFQEQPSSRSLV